MRARRLVQRVRDCCVMDDREGEKKMEIGMKELDLSHSLRSLQKSRAEGL